MKTSYTLPLSARNVCIQAMMILLVMVAHATVHTVHVANFSFTPNAVNAVVGDTMQWQWTSGTHTTTSLTVPSGAATWNSPITSGSQTFQYVLTTAGTYTYDCSIHPSTMTGTITVTAAHPMVPTTKFQKTYSMVFDNVNFRGTSVQQTFDGGFISAGFINHYGAGGDDFFMVKSDSIGNQQWNVIYGDSSNDDANYVLQTADSGYALTGPSFSYGGQTILLAKTDRSGMLAWAKTYGTGDSLSDASSSSMKQTPDGGYIVTGYISNYGAGNDDYYLLKTDATGNIQWSKTYGGGGNDDASSVALTNDGGYIICGTSTSFGDTTMGNIYVVKTDANGTLQWSKDFGSNDGMDMANSIQQTTDKGYIIGGITMGPAFGEFATLLKIDSTGTIEWTRAYGTGDVSSDASAASVAQTADGGYVFAGYISNFGGGSDDFYLVKTNAGGDTIFTRTYGDTAADDANFVIQTSDGGYMLIGNTTNFGLGEQQIYAVKTDTGGNSPCHQYNTGSTINGNLIFSVHPTLDTVSTGGVAKSVTPLFNQGGVSREVCITTGINEVTDKAEIKVYPNPSSGQFEITSSKLIQSVEAYDLTGRIVYTREINATNTSIDLSRQAKGVYMLRLVSENETSVMKIIVSN